MGKGYEWRVISEPAYNMDPYGNLITAQPLSTQVSKAVYLSVLHGAVAMALGAAIESAMPPSTSETAPIHDLGTLCFETTVQLGLNGVAVGLASRFVADDSDPTAGIPFGCALLAAQPGLDRRLGRLATELRATLRSVARRHKSRAPA